MAEEIVVDRTGGDVVVRIGTWKTVFMVKNLTDAEFIRKAKAIKAMEDKAAMSDDKYA